MQKTQMTKSQLASATADEMSRMQQATALRDRVDAAALLLPWCLQLLVSPERHLAKTLLTLISHIGVKDFADVVEWAAAIHKLRP